MTVSACMIVKNEEAILARAIDCFKDIIDEIVIVDTGSVDGTKDIARRYTDKIFDFNWCDDFSAARNYALSKCTMDYIYSADADEVIDPENRERFKQLLLALPEEIDVVQMHYGNQTRHGSVYNFDMEYRPKLFRRLRPFRWIDPVHETLDTNVRVFDSDIIVLHQPLEKHSKRDFSIFRRLAKPGRALSPRLHRLYAQELYISGDDMDFQGAYDYFEWTLHEEKFSPDAIRQSQCIVARCCQINKDGEGLLRVALKNVIGKPSAEVSCQLGDYFYSEDDFEEAATWYYTAAFGAETELNIHCSGFIPLKRLSECYQRLDLPEEADKYQKMASTCRPSEETAH